MKTGKRILSLLLILLFVTALIPVAARADPPSGGCPTVVGSIDHNWTLVSMVYPSCTDSGLKKWKCARCGQEYTEYLAPLGHDWDEGVVTRKGEGFVSTVMTYTCKRDPSHIREEELNPIPPILADLKLVLPIYLPDSLHFTLQPQGGSLTRDGDDSHLMTVEVAGGQEPYRYEWKYISQNPNPLDTVDNAALLMAGQSAALSGAYSASHDEWIAALSDLWADSPKEDWIPTGRVPNVDLNLDSPWGCGKLSADGPECRAWWGNCWYFCWVTDADGKMACSDYAKVYYRLRIVEHPQNANLTGQDSVTLSCRAADGSGQFEYSWLFNGFEAKGLTGSTVEVGEPGEYVCRVTDLVTGDTQDSDPAQVYEAEPLHLVSCTEDFDKWEEEAAELIAEFAGGIGPYSCQVLQNGEDFADVPSPICSFLLNITEPGIYRFLVTDSMGAQAECSVRVGVRQLIISKQPEGGRIGRDTEKYPISVTIKDGVPPFTYYLNYFGKDIREKTTSESKCTLNVFDPGVYDFTIIDSLGHWAQSKSVTVEDPLFRVETLTPSAELRSLQEGVNLAVRAYDGKEPYTYQWFVHKEENLKYAEGWVRVGEDSNVICTRQPGLYYCRVTDDSNDVACSVDMAVTYSGDAPVIVLQPENVLIPNGKSGGFALYCDAVPPTGSSPEDLRYDWYCNAVGSVRWNKCGYGQILSRSAEASPFSDGPIDICGLYYCLVTDTRTGKYTASDKALVDLEIKITDGPYSVPYDGAWTEDSLSIAFVGGIPPYEVSLYLKNTYTTIDPYKDDFSEQDLITREGSVTAEKAGRVAFHAPSHQDSYYFLGETAYHRRVRAQYFFVIKDRYGQTLESEIAKVHPSLLS